MEKFENKINSIKQMIKRLGYGEQDPPVRQFFSVLSGISGESYFENMLAKILQKRPEVTGEHLSYLIYISLQYLTDFAYDEQTRKEKLQADLVAYSDKIIELCRTKYASTNVIERYAFLQIILGMLNKKCIVIDSGASIGIGLMALNSDKFSKIETGSELQQYIRKKAEISKAIGIDVQSPDLKWQSACYLPENRKNRIGLERDYKMLTDKGTKINLMQGSLLDMDKINLPQADIIWTSNVLYEIEGDVGQVMKNIRNLLKAGGIWINADYRHDDKAFATKENPYVAMVRVKEKWNTLLEVLEAPSDSVRAITPGKDFNIFKSACG
ncbi:Uncharacterised protein [uncultured archaeon]|nr:Uncharacterised protein [uncultured archaeon]